MAVFNSLTSPRKRKRDADATSSASGRRRGGGGEEAGGSSLKPGRRPGTPGPAATPKSEPSSQSTPRPGKKGSASGTLQGGEERSGKKRRKKPQDWRGQRRRIRGGPTSSGVVSDVWSPANLRWLFGGWRKEDGFCGGIEHLKRRAREGCNLYQGRWGIRVLTAAHKLRTLVAALPG